MSRRRAALLALAAGICGVVLGAGATYGLIARSGGDSLFGHAFRRPSPFLTSLSPPDLVAAGSAAGGRWEWTECTGPEVSRGRTHMRNFVGHARLDPKAGDVSFIVNDFQHQVWAAIRAAGGELLESNDGRYHNGQTRTDIFRDGRGVLAREYQYACYRVGNVYGVAHMIGFRDGEDLTVTLIVHEQ